MIKIFEIKNKKDIAKAQKIKKPFMVYANSYEGELEEFSFEGNEFIKMFLGGPYTKVVGQRAFANCWNLQRFDALVEVLDKESFIGCKSLTDFNFSTLRNLSEGCFAFSGLKSIDMPFNIQNIPPRCFQATLGLRNLNLNKVENVEEEAFQSSGIKVLDINVNLEHIGKKAFEGCSYLSDIVCERIIPPKIEASSFYGTFVKNVWVFSEAQLDFYLKNRYWSKFSGHYKLATPKVLKERMQEIRSHKDDIFSLWNV